MREGELCALRWQDLKEVEIERDGENVKLLSISVNWTLKSISKKKQHLAHYSANHLWGNFYLTTPKTARSLRTILVEGDTLAVLMEHKKEQQEKRFPVNLDLVFPTRNGTPYAPRNLIRDWTKLVAEAGVPYITFHDLRDTNASYTAVRSKSFVALRDKLGHAETATTLKKYVHLLPESNLDAVLSLERMLGVKVDD
jgi:integrase